MNFFIISLLVCILILAILPMDNGVEGCIWPKNSKKKEKVDEKSKTWEIFRKNVYKPKFYIIILKIFKRMNL